MVNMGMSRRSTLRQSAACSVSESTGAFGSVMSPPNSSSSLGVNSSCETRPFSRLFESAWSDIAVSGPRVDVVVGESGAGSPRTHRPWMHRYTLDGCRIHVCFFSPTIPHPKVMGLPPRSVFAFAICNTLCIPIISMACFEEAPLGIKTGCASRVTGCLRLDLGIRIKNAWKRTNEMACRVSWMVHMTEERKGNGTDEVMEENSEQD